MLILLSKYAYNFWFYNLVSMGQEDPLMASIECWGWQQLFEHVWYSNILRK